MAEIEFSEDDIPTDQNRAEAAEMIQSLRQAKGLRAIDRDFLDSIERQFEEHGILTSGQRIRLRSLHARHIG